MVAPRLITASKYNQRIRRWARDFAGPRDRFGVMSSPPTLTKGSTQTSSVNSSYVNNSVQVNGQDVRLSWLGGPYIDVTSVSIPTKSLQNVTQLNASKASSGLTRVRFMTDSPAVDFCFVEGNGLDVNLIVDGQMAARAKPFGFANTGNIRWVKGDFGTNVVTYALDNAPGPTAGGSGYAMNDLITLNGGGGGAGGTAARLRVAGVSSGAVTAVTVDLAGAYDAQPTGSFSQASTTGSGTGATFSTAILSRRHSTRKMRTWELLVRGNTSALLGLVLTAGCTILPAPAPTSMPIVMFIGDSITAGTYTAYAGAEMASTIAQRLGFWDRHMTRAQGGTGWNLDNGQSARWSASVTLADIVAAAPDVLVYIGSQNDTAGASLETAISAALNSLQASLPDALFVGIGNIMGDSTALAASIATGWAGATDQTRVRFLNNQAPNEWIPGATISEWATVGDGNHPQADSIDWFATMAATQIGAALVDMALAA